jgi:DNA-binding beta-propeller fold protein YncE
VRSQSAIEMRASEEMRRSEGREGPLLDASSGWSLVREIGIEYAEPAQDRGELALCHPVLIEPAGAHRHLIVDEIGLEKARTVRIECRTLVVDDRSRILFDSHAFGVEDGYGCSLGDGRVALLRRSTWEILLLDASYRVTGRIDLCASSRRMPRVVSWTPRGTLLVSFVDAVREVDIVELDLGGGQLWYLPQHATPVGCPSSVHLSEAGNVLVADDFLHAVFELDREGRTVWRYGEPKHPASDAMHLSAPKSVTSLPDGRRLIADSGNHRVLLVQGDRCLQSIESDDVDLRAPAFAARSPSGGTLICDAGNRRIVEIDAQGAPTRRWGSALARRRSFSFPRSIEVSGGRLLVADTARDRVVEFSEGQVEAWQVGEEAGLFWPRCARRTHRETLVVADGRNSRIVELGRSGELRNELHRLQGSDWQALGDPHDVRMLPNGRLLVADSVMDVVAEIDWSGRIHRLVGLEGPTRLDDPHSVQDLDDGRWLICDSGNSRVIQVDAGGRIVEELCSLVSGPHRSRLHRPRYAELGADGTLLIVDSANNRVLAAGPDRELLWELSAIPGSPIPHLDQPRWAQLVSRNELFVSDHSNHRVLQLMRREGLDA